MWSSCCNLTNEIISAPRAALPLKSVCMTNSRLLVFTLPKNDTQRHMNMMCLGLSPQLKSLELGMTPDTSFEDITTSFGSLLPQI